MIRQMPGAIGYIELVYAEQNRITHAALQNAAGNFVKASVESTTAAAAEVEMPQDFRVSVTNAPGVNAYPISSFTWLLVPTRWQDQHKRDAVVGFLHWMLDEGQKSAPQLGYAPLPDGVREQVREAIQQIE